MPAAGYARPYYRAQARGRSTLGRVSPCPPTSVPSAPPAHARCVARRVRSAPPPPAARCVDYSRRSKMDTLSLPLIESGESGESSLKNTKRYSLAGAGRSGAAEVRRPTSTRPRSESSRAG